MAVEPTYTIYPILELKRVEDSFESDNNFAGSIGALDEGTTAGIHRTVSSRKGAFIIGFLEHYNNPADLEDRIAFTFEQEPQSESTYKKRFLNIFLAQHQFSDISSNDGATYALSRLLSTRFYNLRIYAYSASSNVMTSAVEIANSSSSYAASSTHYYPLDFTNCLTYDSSNELFQFQLKPLLDNNGSVINNNTLFKGYYILN